jgi:hypothetical protein
VDILVNGAIYLFPQHGIAIRVVQLGVRRTVPRLLPVGNDNWHMHGALADPK